MRLSNFPDITRPKVLVGWLTIVTQAVLPLSVAYAPVVQAGTETEPKWYQSGLNNPSVFDNNHASSLSKQDTSGDASGMARSAATGALNNSVEEWLSQFGTARVQLNLDDKFKTSGSEADLLVPLYDDKSTVLFTQLGFRHLDERNTGNLGLGARHVVGDWMLGVNTFYDNDFTGDNRRLGLGVEAWRDYLKLSGNSYIRLSDWHQSRDFTDYDERPANGYDIRAEGWLPAYPQLGAKVMYEQYYGQEVALFGKDNRQQDPWAFTGGITYTPVPLFTVGAQHRAGKDGQNDSQVNLQLNYRLGESWEKQLDPGQVGASRTLAGTRYDLVERNNTIVLDYRKQETIKLTLPEKTSGKSRTILPVTFSVKSKHPLQRIDWDAPALLAAGGTITQTGNTQLSIALPTYLPAGNNVYHIAGVAYDTQGNSGSATTQISVEAGDFNVSASTITASPPTLPADGKSTSTLRLNLVDAEGNPLPGMAKSLSATVKETLNPAKASVKTARTLASTPQAATISAVEETAPGIYQATVTAGTRLSTITISTKFNEHSLPDVTITHFADDADGHFATGALVTLSDNNIADSIAANVVEATVTDTDGNPMANTAVAFSLSGSATPATGSSLNVVTDNKGTAKIAFVNSVAEGVTVTASLANGNTASVETHFKADGRISDLRVSRKYAPANGTSEIGFFVQVTDSKGNPVSGAEVSFDTDFGRLSAKKFITEENGYVTAHLYSDKPGDAQVVVSVNGSSTSAEKVSFKEHIYMLLVSNSTIVANGLEMAFFRFEMKDAYGNPVSGEVVQWATDHGDMKIISSVTDSAGIANMRLSSTVPGVANVTATVRGETTKGYRVIIEPVVTP